MSKFEHFCWVWRFKNELFESLADQVPYLRLRLEGLVDAEGGWAGLDRIARFLDLDEAEPTGDRRVLSRNAGPGGGFPLWPLWDPEKARVLQRWCGKLMERYHYGGERAWTELLGRERDEASGARRGG